MRYRLRYRYKDTEIYNPCVKINLSQTREEGREEEREREAQARE